MKPDDREDRLIEAFDGEEDLESLLADDPDLAGDAQTLEAIAEALKSESLDTPAGYHEYFHTHLAARMAEEPVTLWDRVRDRLRPRVLAPIAVAAAVALAALFVVQRAPVGGTDEAAVVAEVEWLDAGQELEPLSGGWTDTVAEQVEEEFEQELAEAVGDDEEIVLAVFDGNGTVEGALMDLTDEQAEALVELIEEKYPRMVEERT